jgi:chromosomal replication initiation ATPase DnaA
MVDRQDKLSSVRQDHGLSELARAFFPSWRLGYRSNPFRALTPDEWRRLALVPTGLQDLIDSPGRLTQIIGDQGAGKTSLLLALERSLLDAGRQVAYEYLPFTATDFKTDLNSINLLLVDEAQRLSRSSLRRLLSSIALTRDVGLQVILSSHTDLARFAADKGIPMRTIRLETLSRSFTEALIEQRLKYFERPGYSGVRLSAAALGALTAHCGADLRGLERLLYEIYQTWDDEGAITSHFVRAIIYQIT